VTPATGPGSHHLTALARANALIIMPGPVTVMSAGDAVGVLELPS
jgi:molybdopterin biosynthesis enzyme